MLTNETYRAIFYAAIVIWSVPELIGAIAQNWGVVRAGLDRGSVFVMLTAMFISIVMSIMLSFRHLSPLLTSYQAIGFWLGILLMLSGVAFRWYAIRYLGHAFSLVVTVQLDQQVVTTGPYRLIRHPAYTGILIVLLGYALVLNDWASLLVLFAINLAAIWYRVRVEEHALVETLGQTYLAYMRRTRRFIPFLL